MYRDSVDTLYRARYTRVMTIFTDGRYRVTYDPDDIQVALLYFESEDAFVCSCCVEDGFHVSMLHASEGGNHLPIRVSATRRSLKKLRNEVCLWCGLSVGRSFD